MYTLIDLNTGMKISDERSFLTAATIQEDLEDLGYDIIILGENEEFTITYEEE